MITFDDYITRATAALEKGFSTKSARKNAIGDVRSAFECGTREISSELLAEPRDARRAGFDELYWGIPDLHVWKPKHSEIFAAFPAALAKIEVAVALRAKIVAAPDVAKAPPARTAKQLAADAAARTCQICGRPIFAEVGVIAHHGYQRPGDGWQTASCDGARELPFEAAKDALVAHVARQVQILADLVATRKKIAAEKLPVSIAYDVDRRVDGKLVYYRGERLRDTIYVDVTRSNFAEVYAAHPIYFKAGYDSRSSFDAILKSALVGRDRRIEQQRAYIEWQKGRLAAWKLLEKWDGKKWEAAR